MFNNKLITQLKQQVSQLQQSNSKLKLELDAQVLNNSLLKNEYIDYYKIKASLDSINSVSDKLQSINDTILSKQHELSQLQSQIDVITSANYIQTLGLYDLKYDSKYYIDELNSNRLEQRNMLSSRTHYNIIDKWVVNGDFRQGSLLLEFLLTVIVSSFNLYCDSTLNNISILNYDHIKNRISKIYNNYNDELIKHGVELSDNYLKLKLKEVDLRYFVKLKQQDDKDEEIRRKEILREQIRANLEITKSKERLEKELLHYQIQLNKGADVQDKIDEIGARIETEDYLLNKNSAGYVYFIKSKSFNDDEYTKVGVTKRLNPIERVSELSNASVPFKFYPLAIVFSEQAFDLEHKLHQRLDKYRVNKFNTRKEHFKIDDDELLKIVRDEFGYDIEFNEIVDEDWIYTNNFKGENK